MKRLISSRSLTTSQKKRKSIIHKPLKSYLNARCSTVSTSQPERFRRRLTSDVNVSKSETNSETITKSFSSCVHITQILQWTTKITKARFTSIGIGERKSMVWTTTKSLRTLRTTTSKQFNQLWANPYT